MNQFLCRTILLLFSFTHIVGWAPLRAQDNFEEDMKKAAAYVQRYDYFNAQTFYKYHERQLRPEDRFYYAICLKNDKYPTEAVKAEFLRQLKLSSDGGELRARQWLAEIYLEGQLTAQNIKEGLKLLANLCGYEQPKAMYMYGWILNEGKLTQRDTVQAYQQMFRAAEKKYRDAYSTLAWWHYSGSGAPKDWNKAKYFYKEAAKEGDAKAQYNYVLLLLENPAETSLGVKELEYAVNFLSYVPSIFLLAQTYEEGRYGVKQDVVKALGYYHRIVVDDGAEKQFPEAYRSALAAVRREGSTEPNSDSKTLRMVFDQLASRMGQSGSATTVSEQWKNLYAAYKPLEALGFHSKSICGVSSIKRLSGDAKTDSSWMRTPYHRYELKVVHAVEEKVADNVFLRWNRILQKTYPEYNLEGNSREARLIIPLSQQQKMALELENDDDQVLLRVFYYKTVEY
jgi:TPR repeat protein